MGRWVRPEVYPLFAAMSAVVGLCVYQLGRNLGTNPEVRLSKEGRMSGILENYEEGERYAEHGVRKFVRDRPSEVMPSINNFFSKPDKRTSSKV